MTSVTSYILVRVEYTIYLRKRILTGGVFRTSSSIVEIYMLDLLESASFTAAQ